VSLCLQERLYDGGFSDPLPSDPELDTVAVSILNGKHVDVCPDYGGTGVAPRYLGSPFLRYSVTPQNARALFETTFLTPKRARARFDQGQHDARAFLAAWHRRKREHHEHDDHARRAGSRPRA